MDITPLTSNFMQTFLPYRSFHESARALDYRRLGKQRVECKQILRALREGGGWANHPAVLMWSGCEVMLAWYGQVICAEWRRRGYNDSLIGEFYVLARGERVAPWWLGLPEFHLAHKSNLIRKDPSHYQPLFPGVPDDLPYVWPVVK